MDETASGFGEFVSGTVTLTGAEEPTYSTGDPAYTFDADLSAGTGTYGVEDVTLIDVTDGDLAASRSYSGPGTMSITEHDTGGVSADLNARRMAITLEGTLEADGPDGDGEVDAAADVLWVMGCP